MEADRFLAPLQATRITGRWLARKAGTPSIAALWDLLAERPFPVATARIDKEEFDNRFPGIRAMITKRAADAIAHRIDLLGSGPVELGAEIDWLRDFKTGDRWPPAFCRSIDYVNKGRPSDVKCPWELSRLQWLIPAAQAYQFTGDEAYAVCVRDILLQWIEANPYAWTVNWSCTMEPALRLQTWTYFFHVFARTAAWQSREFQARYLSMLYLHGVFTEKHIERSTINGNHLTADAAGMVFAGLFFRGIGDGDRWAEQGWQTLEQEIRLQVYPDGIDFEASTAYHRLCAELFLGPARYRLAAGLPVNDLYEARLRKMADFVDAYMRPDGTSPNWGDADDGRALPFGTQEMGDHRYLPALVEATFGKAPVACPPAGGEEVAWHGGLDRVGAPVAPAALKSKAFPDGGVYILASGDNHVFIDCGPVGLAGLGGHGHNDALSFEAWLGGVPLIVDPGSYVYTASFDERNAFRATAAHNTPQVDGREVNRLYSPDNLWNLHDDAKCKCLDFESLVGGGRFEGLHSGYTRYGGLGAVQRTVTLDAAGRTLRIVDMLDGQGARAVRIPLHLSEGVCIEQTEGLVLLSARGRQFSLSWQANCSLQLLIEETRTSSSYGVSAPIKRIVLTGMVALPLKVAVVLTQHFRQ